MGKLWFGGTIYTLQAEGETIEAIYTKGDQIIKIGEQASLEREFEGHITERIDLGGKTLFPGFVDSHIHLIGHGETLIRLDLSNFASKEEVLKAVKQYAKKMNPGEWIIGEGWNENRWVNHEIIRCEELDEVAPDHPVVLKRICRHALVVNSAALKLAGIHEGTICPTGGVIDKNEHGKITGFLKDKAQDLILAVIPVVSEEYLQNAMRAAIQDLYTLGLTGVHTEDLHYYGGFSRTYRTFKKIIEEEGWKFRTHLLVHHEVIQEMIDEGGGYLSGNEWIEFGAMKIFADGALGGRTALLSKPYHDDPETNGVAIFSQDVLNHLVKTARQWKMPVAIHAIGDLGFDYALSAIEQNPIIGKGRDRLIHAQILRKDLIDRAKQLPLILDIQPGFLSSDFPWVIDRVGGENMKYCYAWKTLIEEIPCAGGSDAPIELPNPLLGIHAAVTRRVLNDPEGTVYGAEEALSMYDAVCLYTKGSAIAGCHEHERGLIKEGYLADFTVFDQNLFQIQPAEITNVQAMMTIIGGEIVFDRNND